MVNLAVLSKRARMSEDGEAYLPIAKTPGFRLGVGARAVPGRGPDFFVEVVLDPFPDRPEVNLSRMMSTGGILERLRCRGYAMACDDAGVLTCERTVEQASLTRELRETQGALSPPTGKGRSRRGA